MSIFLFIYTAILIHIFSKPLTQKKRLIYLLVFTCTIEIFRLRGYLIKVSGFSVGPDTISELILFLYAVRYSIINKVKLNQRVFYANVLFVAVLILGLLSEVVVPYDHNIVNSTTSSWDAYFAGTDGKAPVNIGWGYSLQLLCKAVIASYMICLVKSDFAERDIREVIYRITKYSMLLVYTGVIEAIVRYILHASTIWDKLFSFILGGDLIITKISEGRSEDLLALVGLEREPSHFVESLFIICILIGICNKLKQDDVAFSRITRHVNLKYITIFILMVLSGGFSAVWAITMAILITSLQRRSVYRVTAVTIVMLFFILMGGYYLTPWVIDCLAAFDGEGYFISKLNLTFSVLEDLIINHAFYNIHYTSSTLARLGSIVDTFGDVINRPFLGLGIGIEGCHGGLVTALSSAGFAGFFLWLYMLLAGKRTIYHIDEVLFCMVVFVANLPLDFLILLCNVCYGVIFLSTTLYTGKKV